MPEEEMTAIEELCKPTLLAPNVLESISSLLGEQPTAEIVFSLVIEYTILAADEPFRAPAIAAALAEVVHGHQGSNNASLASWLYEDLADQHIKGLLSQDGPHSWGPENSYLIESYLSGLSLKYDLTSTKEMLGAVTDGLEAVPKTPYAQELIVGACLQLLLAGKLFTSEVTAGPNYYRSATFIASKLRIQQRLGIVENADAARILDVSHVPHSKVPF